MVLSPTVLKMLFQEVILLPFQKKDNKKPQKTPKTPKKKLNQIKTIKSM
jgi:hypothetical protein